MAPQRSLGTRRAPEECVCVCMHAHVCAHACVCTYVGGRAGGTCLGPQPLISHPRALPAPCLPQEHWPGQVLPMGCGVLTCRAGLGALTLQEAPPSATWPLPKGGRLSTSHPFLLLIDPRAVAPTIPQWLGLCPPGRPLSSLTACSLGRASLVHCSELCISSQLHLSQVGDPRKALPAAPGGAGRWVQTCSAGRKHLISLGLPSTSPLWTSHLVTRRPGEGTLPILKIAKNFLN